MASFTSKGRHDYSKIDLQRNPHKTIWLNKFLCLVCKVNFLFGENEFSRRLLFGFWFRLNVCPDNVTHSCDRSWLSARYWVNSCWHDFYKKTQEKGPFFTYVKVSTFLKSQSKDIRSIINKRTNLLQETQETPYEVILLDWFLVEILPINVDCIQVNVKNLTSIDSDS